MKTLTLDEIQGLLKKEEHFDEDVEMQVCASCGSCENPDTCVYSVQCPKCFAPPTQQCTEGSRLVGLHEERHKYANSTFWRQYRV